MGEANARALRLVATTDTAELLLDEWELWGQARGLADRTRAERRRIVEQVAAAVGLHPAAFTEAALIRWLAAVERPSTRLTYFRALQAWHRWLLDTGRRGDDPTLRLPKPREPRRKPHPAATSGLERLLVSGVRTKTRAMILLAAYAGLRVSELAKVRGEDVDLDAGELRVVGKGGFVRHVPLGPILLDLASTMPRRGYWFPSAKDPAKPMRRDTASSTISRAMARAGVVGTAHSLRHWFGTESLAASGNLRVAQELLGHGSVATTQLYTAVAPEQLLAAVVALPDFTRGRNRPIRTDV